MENFSVDSVADHCNHPLYQRNFEVVLESEDDPPQNTAKRKYFLNN